MAGYLLRGILIGLMFGLPVGAVGAMTVQRTWNFGLKAGLLTGLGSTVADCFYAVIGAFGITLVSDFLLQYQTIIHILGGIVLLLMGIQMFLKHGETAVTEVNATGRLKLFLSSFAIGITNPAAILAFLFAFSYFGISGVTELAEGVALVCGVFLGTYFWWGTISFATYGVKQKATNHSFPNSNKVFGGILTLLGTIIFVRSFFESNICF